MKFGNKNVGLGHPPFVIAEMSGNHNKSLQRALEIVDAAAEAGAHAIKLQTYTADTMTLDIKEGEFLIKDPKSLWNGRNLFELYHEAHTPWDWHKPIFDRAREKGMLAFSTPFDETAVDFLESLNAPFYKIASFENTDLPLIRRVAKTGKPVIVSLGMASLSEMEDCVRTLREAGCEDFVLLKCTSTYPATPENTHIRTIPHLRDLFQCEVGLSDHTMGIGVAVASVALGAVVIEKHFTLRRADGGVDSAFSIEPAELKSLVVETERAWQGLGSIQYGATKQEETSMQFRRSLYLVRDLPAGHRLSAQDVRAIRPGYGLPPKYIDHAIGKILKSDVKKGTALQWELLS
jgi:N-acetylneuraminate synthase